jgi:antibiotic biosynthesis monooxygenase
MLRFTVESADEAEQEFVGLAHAALEVLAQRQGYLHGRLARSYDEPAHWCLVTEWDSVGSYRRALSSYEVKVRATPLLSRAVPEASAFEVLATAGPGAVVTVVASDLAGRGRQPGEVG